MALREEYVVNRKLFDLLQNGVTGGRDIVAVIRAAFVDAGDAILIKLMIDLRALVTLLNERRTDAVQALLTLDWTSKSPSVIQQHADLLISIASAHACHLPSVMRFYVKIFLPSSPIPPNESSDDYDSKKALWREAHKCISQLLDIVPMSERTLVKTLRDCYPFMKRPLVHLWDYCRNLLTVISYAPRLRLDILGLIVDELMKLDTACSHEALEAASVQEAIASSSGDNEVFQMEPDYGNDHHHRSEKKCVNEVLDMREKLDICMYELFQYISKSKSNGDESERMSLYTDLLTIFETSVLPVFSSHHVQFLWFVYCSFDQEYWKHLLSWLWQRVQTPSTSASIRQNAACYMASYLARANYLDVDVARTSIETWVQWIHAYIDNREGAGANGKAAMHSAFYSVCQAVFYVIVFRVKEILDDRKGHDFLKSLNFDRIVTCRLNPLKYCAEKVVAHFASVSRTYQFAFCYTVIERNRRSAFFDQRRTGIAPNQLIECFFPFDPFLLPKCGEFVRPVYRDEEEIGADDIEISSVNLPSMIRGCVDEDDDVDDFLDDIDDPMEFSPTADCSRAIMEATTRELMLSCSISPGYKHG